MEETPKPLAVEYCTFCSFPFEYCQFASKKKQHAKFLLANFPEKVQGMAWVREAGQQQSKEERKEEAGVREGKEEKKEKGKEEKKEKKQKHKLKINVKDRAKNKYTTTLTFAENFAFPDDLSRTLSKKFACSVSQSKKGEFTIQGNFGEEVEELAVSQWGLKQSEVKLKMQITEPAREQAKK